MKTDTIDNSIDDWPIEAQRAVQRLRSECAFHRIEKNAARRERDAVVGDLIEARQRIASLMLDNADLKAGIIPQGA